MPPTGGRKWLGAALSLLLLVAAGPWWEEQAITSIDGGWMTALTDAGARGQIAGRDFHATYGWGFQQVGLWARSLHRQHSSVDSVALLSLLLWSLGAACLVAALVLIGPRDVGGMVLVAMAALAAAMACRIQAIWVRPMALVLIAALTSRALAEPRTHWRVAELAGLGALAASLQLLAYDTALFAVATVLGAVLLISLGDARGAWQERIRRSFLFTTAAGAGATAATIAICGALSADGTAFFASLAIAGEIVRGYTATMALAWQVGPATSIGLATLSATTLWLAWREGRSSQEARRDVLPLALVGLLSLRAATIRSDAEHLGLALLPLLVLLVRQLVRLVSGWTRSSAAVFVATLALLSQANRSPSSMHGLPDRWRELRDLDRARHLLGVRGSLAAGDPAVALAVFPSANQLGLVAGRRLELSFVQAYQATSALLDGIAAGRLKESGAPLEALVAEDGALDEVQSMTRNPAIFEVLWRRFRFVAADRGESPILDLDPGAQILLRRSVNPRELPMQPIFRAASDSRSTTMALAAPVWCTLLRITFVVDYPWSANLGRKAPWQVAVSDGARGIVTARVVALDQARFSTFVDLLPPAETGAIFRGDAPRRRFDRLEISSADRSLFAVQPRFVHLAEVDCVNP